jgi:hypothetical protein
MRAMSSTGVWARWKRLIRRGCKSAAPIALDDALAHVEAFFVGSEIFGDNLKCRLARKLRRVENRFEAARLATGKADSCPSAETPTFAPVPRRSRTVWARMCASKEDASCAQGLDAFLSLEVASTGETLLLFECDKLKPHRVKLSLLRFSFASDRVLGMHGVATRDQTVAHQWDHLAQHPLFFQRHITAALGGPSTARVGGVGTAERPACARAGVLVRRIRTGQLQVDRKLDPSVSCYLLFDDDTSLKRFTAMCNGY